MTDATRDPDRVPKRERTRARIVEAAMAVVAERGFHAAGVSEIGERAGLSTGALYGNFENKDAILLAVFEEHLRWFDAGLSRVAEATDVQAALREWLGSIGAEPEQFLVFVEFWAYAVRRPELRRRLAEHLAAMRERTAAQIAARDDLAGTPAAAAPALGALVSLALARGLAFERLAAPEDVSDDDLAAVLALLLSP